VPLPKASTFVGSTAKTSAGPPPSWWTPSSVTSNRQLPCHLFPRRPLPQAAASRCKVARSVTRRALRTRPPRRARGPSVAARRQHDIGVRSEVDRLLLCRAGGEVKRSVEPHRDQRGDVRAPVRTHRRNPADLGRLEHLACRRPRRRLGIGIAETAGRAASPGQTSSLRWSMTGRPGRRGRESIGHDAVEHVDPSSHRRTSGRRCDRRSP
jgi:hypothetical protein